MNNTPETRALLWRIASALDNLNTDYLFTVRKWGSESQYIFPCISKPHDTDDVVYPEIRICNNAMHDDEVIRIEITTSGYSERSLRQAQRVIAGLCVATNVVEHLYTAFECAGFETQR